MGDIFGKNQAPPPAPDYKGAAQATQASQMVSQYTPYGNQVYSQASTDSQGNPLYRSDISLSPTGQQLLDLQNKESLDYGNQAVQGLDRVNQSFAKPFDYGSVGQVQDASYGAQTARLDPQWAQNAQANETQLRNQGIPVGSEAWDNEMRTFNQAKNDAYSQARLQAINTAPQTYQLAQSLRDQPLNEVNALRTGSQVTTPTFTPAGSQPQANYLGAAQAGGQYNMGTYNAGVAQNNAAMNGLFSIGAAAAGSPWAGKAMGF